MLMMRYSGERSRLGDSPIATFCVQPNRLPLLVVRSISASSGNRPVGTVRGGDESVDLVVARVEHRVAIDSWQPRMTTVRASCGV